jgi:hypothetical protein
MGVNRYSNLSQAKFNPLSFQELSALPFHQRKQHDAMSAQAEEAGIIESQRMAADEEAVAGAINDFQAKTDDYINRLDSEGFNNTSKSEIRELARERKELMSTGIVGRKQAQYDRYAANMKQLDKDRDKISPYKYQALQQKAVEDYTKAVKEDPNASYRDVLAVKDHDIQKDARQIALDVQKNPQILTDFGFTPIPGAPGQYWNSKTQTKYTGEGDIANAIYSIMGQNREVMDDLYQREQLDLLGDQSATDYLKNVGLSFEGYGVNQVTKSRSGFTNQMQVNAINKSTPDNNVPYSFDPVESFKIQQESFLDKLKNISEEKTVPGGVEASNNINDSNAYGVKFNKDVKPTVEANFSNENEMAKFNSIKDKLIKEDIINEEMPVKVQTEIMHKYLSQFKDVPYQNPIIEPNSSRGALSSSLLLDTKDVNSTNRNIINKINDGRMKLWDEKGNSLKLDDLPKGYKVEYTGYIGATNLLPVFKNADPSQSVAPHRIQIKNKNGEFVTTAYGSRNEYERNTPEFRAYSRIKSNLNINMSEPGLPETFNVSNDPKLGKMLSKYESAYNPLNKTYTLKLYNKQGELTKEYYDMPEEEMQNKWHTMYKLLD